MVISSPFSLMQTEPGSSFHYYYSFPLLILIFVLPFSEEIETPPTWLLKAQHISLLPWSSHSL